MGKVRPSFKGYEPQRKYIADMGELYRRYIPSDVGMTGVNMIIKEGTGMAIQWVSWAILVSACLVSSLRAGMKALGKPSYIKHNSETLIIDINYKWSNPIQSTISTQLVQKGVA